MNMIWHQMRTNYNIREHISSVATSESNHILREKKLFVEIQYKVKLELMKNQFKKTQKEK